MSPTVLITRDVESRYRGFLSSTMPSAKDSPAWSALITAASATDATADGDADFGGDEL